MKLPGLEWSHQKKKKKKHSSVGRKIGNRRKHWMRENSMESMKVSYYLCFDSTDSASNLAGNSS